MERTKKSTTKRRVSSRSNPSSRGNSGNMVATINFTNSKNDRDIRDEKFQSLIQTKNMLNDQLEDIELDICNLDYQKEQIEKTKTILEKRIDKRKAEIQSLAS